MIHKPGIQPFAVGPGQFRDVDDGDSGRPQFNPQPAPAVLLLVEKKSGLRLIAVNCWAGVRPSWLVLLTPLATWPFKPATRTI